MTQRNKLEKLCRYITRPPIANERLSTNERGQVIYKFKQPFRDGSTHVVLDPLDFIARSAALVPRPRLNLPRSTVCSLLIANTDRTSSQGASPSQFLSRQTKTGSSSSQRPPVGSLRLGTENRT